MSAGEKFELAVGEIVLAVGIMAAGRGGVVVDVTVAE